MWIWLDKILSCRNSHICAAADVMCLVDSHLQHKGFVWDFHQKLQVKIGQNRAKITLFCLEISISCCLKTQIWQNRCFQVIMHCDTVLEPMFGRALTGDRQQGTAFIEPGLVKVLVPVPTWKASDARSLLNGPTQGPCKRGHSKKGSRPDIMTSTSTSTLRFIYEFA